MSEDTAPPKSQRGFFRYSLRTMLLVTALAVIVLGYLAYRAAHPNRIVVRNSSGVVIQEVHVELHDVNGDSRTVAHYATLEPDAAVVLRHSMNDLEGKLRFVLAGAAHEHNEAYIDLWTGEGWLFDIQTDGVVKSGYDRQGDD